MTLPQNQEAMPPEEKTSVGCQARGHVWMVTTCIICGAAPPDAVSESRIEWLLMLLAKYRDCGIDHNGKCKFMEYPGLGLMDDRCEICKLADAELDRRGRATRPSTMS